ncbi:MAG: apolipoprotein N-acyltransferase, partial [Vicinamibacterales bacterium]
SLATFPVFIQIADFSGSWGLTYLAAAVAGAVYEMTRPMDLQRSRRRRLEAAAFAVGAIVFVLGYGSYRLDSNHTKPGPRVAVIQPNLPSWITDPDEPLPTPELVRLTRQMVQPDSAALVMWPENSGANLFANSDSLRDVVALARELRLEILVDGPSSWPAVSPLRHRLALVGESGRIKWYDKTALVPWSEYVPIAPMLSRINLRLGAAFVDFVKTLNPHLVEFTPGDNLNILSLASGNVSIVPSICYELLDPELLLRWHRAIGPNQIEPTFVVNPVNERLLGRSIHHQTLGFSQIRAVEARLSIVRATNNGISAVIDPMGQVSHGIGESRPEDSIDSVGSFTATILLDDRVPTPYMRWGDWLPMASLLFTLLSLSWPKRLDETR